MKAKKNYIIQMINYKLILIRSMKDNGKMDSSMDLEESSCPKEICT